ncbi:hypothetical protein [Marinococcus halophilus]|uniref:hypothetical protein n=1 Tax=Marinococcus halophilus TaxID=1371 RepID=UPI0009A7AA96|nr:hypothetical protein [Marinococcus halophilus]
MRFGDIIFMAVLLLPGISGMIVFIMMGGTGTGTLPSLETMKGIYDRLWTIALFITVAGIALIFFVKKDDELTLKLGLPAMVFLIGADIIVNQMPI